jgi:hypothetical protein
MKSLWIVSVSVLQQGCCALGRRCSRFASGSLAASLNFVIATNTSVGIETVSPDRALGSTTPNWWSLLCPNPNTTPLIVIMTPWLLPRAIDCIL